MFFTVIGIIILAYSCINFKKGFFLFLFFNVFWLPSTKILSIPGLPTITLNLLMSLTFFLLYIIVGNKYKSTYLPCPFNKPFLVIALSFFVTCFFSVAGFLSEFSRSISVLLQDYIMVIIAWNIIDSQKDFKKLEKGFIVIFFIAGLFGLIEYILKDNFLVNYKSILNPTGVVLYSNTGEALKRGYRVVSLFEHPIGAGMSMSLFVVFMFSLLIKYDEKINLKRKILSLVAVVLCSLCVFLTKMRSSILFLFIALLAIIDFKKKKFYYYATISVILVLFGYPLFKDNIDVFLSLFSKKAQSSVGGSTLSLRLEQLDAILHLFAISPIGGLGEKFENYISNIYTIKALGYESVWFIQLTRHGIVGAIANIYLMYYSIFKIPKIFKSKCAMFLAISFWVTYSLTSIPSFRLNIYYLLYFYFIKKSNVYKKNRLDKNLKRKLKLGIKIKI